jgi:hypothetical protein
MLYFLSLRKWLTFIHKKTWDISLADSQGTGIPVSQTRKAHAKREHSIFNFEIHLKLPVFGYQKKANALLIF